MSRSNHPIDQEELMAYLDGELATNRAVAAAAHLEHCAECQELAADLRKLSQEMMAWEVEELESAEGTPIAIKAALQDRPGKPRKIKTRLGWRILLTRRGLVWAGGGTVVAVFLLMTFLVSPMRPVRMAQSPEDGDTQAGNYYESPRAVAPPPPPPAKLYAYDSLGRLNTDGKMSNIAPGLVGNQDATRTSSTAEDSSEGDEVGSDHTVPTVPMIARVAGITLSTKEFDKTRAALEEILKRHNGYMGELKVSAPQIRDVH